MNPTEIHFVPPRLPVARIPSLDDSIVESLCGGQDSTALEAKLRSQLGVSAQDSEHLLRQIVAEINNKLFQPITHLELIHTEGCNLGCSYCFERDMLGYRRMLPETARAAVDLLFDYCGNATSLKILHFGGEPTLNFAGIRHATEYAERRAHDSGKSVDFDLTSNGVLLNEEMIDYFAEHRIKVLLSIDGLEESHDAYRKDKKGQGTFARVLRAMYRLKQKQPWVGAKMTVMPTNAQRLFSDVRGLHELGVNQFVIGYATGIEWSQAAMETYTDQMGLVYEWYRSAKNSQLRIADFDESSAPEAYFGCQAGRNSVTVTVDGEISPCSKVLALDSRILVGKLGDVRHGITHLRNRAELVTCSRLKENVAQAGIGTDFRGGCFASNHQATGDMFSPCLQDHRMSVMQRSKCNGCAPHL